MRLRRTDDCACRGGLFSIGLAGTGVIARLPGPFAQGFDVAVELEERWPSSFAGVPARNFLKQRGVLALVAKVPLSPCELATRRFRVLNLAEMEPDQT